MWTEKLSSGIVRKLLVFACICGVLVVGFTYYLPTSRHLQVKAGQDGGSNPSSSTNAELLTDPDDDDGKTQRRRDKSYTWKRDHPKMAKVRQVCNEPESIKILEEGLHPPDYQLRGVAVVTRHGERAPGIPFRGMSKFSCALGPASPHLEEYKTFLNLAASAARVNDSSVVPDAYRRRDARRGRCRAWELTETGAVQAVFNGRAVSDLLLDQGVDGLRRLRPKDDVLVYSTHYRRTLESALAFWAGFVGNHPRMGVEADDDDAAAAAAWPTFEFQRSETFCFQRCRCPRADALREAQKKTMSRFLREHPAVQDLAASLSRILYPPDDKGKMKTHWPGDIMESLVLWLCHGKPFPCLKEESGAKVCVKPQHVASLSTYENRADDLKDDVKMSLQGFGLVEKIVQLADSRFFKNKTKLVVFSGHDYAVEGLLAFFNLKKDLPPVPYAARAVLEFYENTKDPEDRRFRLLYNGKDRTERIPFCAAASEQGGESPLLDIGEETRIWQSVRDPNSVADEAPRRRGGGAKAAGPGDDLDGVPAAPPLMSMCPFDLLVSYVRSGFFGEHDGSSFDEVCGVKKKQGRRGAGADAPSSRETIL